MQRILFVNDCLNGGEVEKLMQLLVRSWHTRYEITIMTEEYQKGFDELYPDDVKYITAKPQPYLRKITVAESRTPSKRNLLKSCIYEFRQKLHDRRFRRQTAPGTFDIIFCMKCGWLMEKYYYLRAPLRYVWVHIDDEDNVLCQVPIHDDNKENAPCQAQNHSDKKHKLAIMKTYTGIICSTQDMKAKIIKNIGDPGNLLVRYDPIDMGSLPTCPADSCKLR